jgi:hypothetical protein
MPESTGAVTATGERRQSVLDLVSIAQGFHERAVILRFLSFEVSALFGSESSRWLIKRIAGGVGQASEAQLAAIASELRDAAGAAQQQAERLLGAVVEVVNDGSVPGLDPRFAALVSPADIEAEDLDTCVVSRPKPDPSKRFVCAPGRLPPV